MNLLEALGLKKKKSRREKVQEALSEGLHQAGDLLEEVAEQARKEAPKVAKKVSKEAPKVAKKVSKEAPKAAKKARQELKSAGATAGEALGSARTQASEVGGAAGDEASAKIGALLAALGGMTADWDEVVRRVGEELEGQRGGQAAPPEGKKKRVKKQRKSKGYPGFWIWLLRLGIGFWFVQGLRGRDLSAFIDHGAGDQMRRQTDGHPVAWYKDLLDNFLIPNASIVGSVTVAAETLSALGYLTGINRRVAALLGILVSGNRLMGDVQEEEEMGKNLAMTLAQLLLLRTGG